MEKHWNGTLLNSVDTIIEWTKTLTWRNICPHIHQLVNHYAKGIKPNKAELKAIQPFIQRHSELGKWDVIIRPEPVNS